MIEYWKEILTVAGGLIVLYRLFSISRKYMTKEEHEKHCKDRLELIRAETKAAVLEAMNVWLKQNGHKLR